uniref:Large ribosomal subunit protein uL5c n=1 Tax=Stichococcus bacillaris TaxID=37433 RepID=A0A097KKK5_9CHLO|nr:ribosomal protein L5 [Stichococcus bacillaris]AIT93687.1 ribosomal protein L5 [Stichococcus bacillaris]|mmetsp:Transcript_11089/g.33243  ORF Transcript_11089/g.33243 Transcript_11089/m.33243 type:complete len:183 (-) Transcript_11089:248-796(-)
MVQRLNNFYLEKIVPELSKQFHYTNALQVPRLKKIVINRGFGAASQNAKAIDSCLEELSIIACQKGIITRSKKPIAGFKLKQNMPVGVAVTLRGERMYAFFDRLINLALPRIRDFRGISLKSFDEQGNYNLGLQQQLMFPEIDYDKIDQYQGMDISIVICSKTRNEAIALLQQFGMPFINKK